MAQIISITNQPPPPQKKKGQSWLNYINQPGHVLSNSFMGEKYSVTENWLVGKTSFEIYLYSVGTICITRKNIGHRHSKGQCKIIKRNWIRLCFRKKWVRSHLWMWEKVEKLLLHKGGSICRKNHTSVAERKM